METSSVNSKNLLRPVIWNTDQTGPPAAQIRSRRFAALSFVRSFRSWARLEEFSAETLLRSTITSGMASAAPSRWRSSCSMSSLKKGSSVIWAIRVVSDHSWRGMGASGGIAEHRITQKTH